MHNILGVHALESASAETGDNTKRASYQYARTDAGTDTVHKQTFFSWLRFTSCR